MARITFTKNYSLDLAKDELQFVYDIMYTRIGGDPYSTRRKIADSIVLAIQDTCGSDLRRGKVKDMSGMVTIT